MAAVAAAWKPGTGRPAGGRRTRPQPPTSASGATGHWRAAGWPLTTGPARSRDLARGLVQASGEDRRMVGRLMRDYERLAEQVLAAITDQG